MQEVILNYVFVILVDMARPVRRIFKRGVLIAATGDLQRGGLGAQPSDADESSIFCCLRVA